MKSGLDVTSGMFKREHTSLTQLRLKKKAASKIKVYLILLNTKCEMAVEETIV